MQLFPQQLHSEPEEGFLRALLRHLSVRTRELLPRNRLLARSERAFVDEEGRPILRSRRCEVLWLLLLLLLLLLLFVVVAVFMITIFFFFNNNFLGGALQNRRGQAFSEVEKLPPLPPTQRRRRQP